jgi:hypothetical protein
VLKVYGAALGRRAATEALALRLLGDVPGVPVPQLVFTGDVRDATPAVPHTTHGPAVSTLLNQWWAWGLSLYRATGS